MNFRRIFLIKCLLLLFPSVKWSNANGIYRAVNESALLNITAAGSVYEVKWLRDSKKLLRIKDKEVKYYVNKDQCRCKIFLNGTLQIEQVMKEDSGNYTVTVYQQDGKLKAEEVMNLVVQEPVPQPILSAECMNKTISVKCEVKQKTKDETFIIELSQDKSKKVRRNATKLELHTRYSGMFRCVVQNQVSKKMAEKVITCSGHLDVYLILSIAGGAIFFVIFMILLIYCIRKKKAERLDDDVARFQKRTEQPRVGVSIGDRWGLPGKVSSSNPERTELPQTPPDEERMMQARQVDSEMVVRELPQPPCNPTPKQLRVQQRPLPQPQVQHQALPPRPRPRTQQRTPNHPRERP